MSNHNGISHVLKEKDAFERPISYCGFNISMKFYLVSVEHAKACIDQERYVQPCKKCMKKINKQEK